MRGTANMIAEWLVGILVSAFLFCAALALIYKLLEVLCRK